MACCMLTAAAIGLVLAIKARLIGRPRAATRWHGDCGGSNDDGTE